MTEDDLVGFYVTWGVRRVQYLSCLALACVSTALHQGPGAPVCSYLPHVPRMHDDIGVVLLACARAMGMCTAGGTLGVTRLCCLQIASSGGSGCLG